MEKRVRIHAFVNGRVQGVGFRYFVHRTASTLDLSGWVKNCGDGRVELVAEGGEQTLQSLITILQNGPALSHVTSVDVQWSKAQGKFDGFDITY